MTGHATPSGRHRRMLLAAAVLGAIAMAIPPGAFAATPPWPARLVWSGWFGDAAAIEATGVVHVVGGDGQGMLWHATDRNGTQTTISMRRKGSDPALAVDGSGAAHVVYVGEGTTVPGIWYATDRSGAWVHTRLTDAGMDKEPAIAVDRHGEAHVSFRRDGTGIYYATDRRGWWIVQQRSDRPNEQQPAIAIGSDRRVSIVAVAAWPDAPGLMLMTDRTGSWVRSRISTGDDTYPAVAVDAAGKVHLASSRGTSVMYRTNSSGAWTAKAWSGGGSPWIGLDGAGAPHVAWGARHATNATGSWVVTSPPVSGSIKALRIAKSGVMRLVLGGYYSAWVVDDSATPWLQTSVGTARRPTSALGPDGSLYVVYLATAGTGDGLIRYRKLTGSTWSTLSTGAVGGSASIAVDGASKVHVAYLAMAIYGDDYQYELRYRTNASGAWTETVLRHAPHLACPTIAVTSIGQAHLAVVDGDRGYGEVEQIIYLTDAGGSWSMGTPLPVSGRPSCPSLDLTAAGKVDVAYRYGDRPAYVTNRTGSWTVKKLGLADDAFPSLATDAGGKVHVAFLRAGWPGPASGLVYATNVSGAWTTSVIGPDCDDYGSIGYDIPTPISVGIAVGATGPPQMACTARAGGVDSIAWRNGSWTTVRIALGPSQSPPTPIVPSMQVTSLGHARIIADRAGSFDVLRND